ncbi:MAG: transglutaminase family protein [Acidobacteria bacterium]|nr:transglutaminase family protein [Acidobacteriota bacterium]MDA1235546.1 transglutaminase family protein [Acidobacteriota bacterium]
MKFLVEHGIEYAYSIPVFLEPHTIRLRPRNDPAQREISFQLEITPQPAQLENALDAQGNTVSYAWFNDQISHLSIHTRTEAETLRSNPFGFLLADFRHDRLPLTYDPADLLHPALLYCDHPGDTAIADLTQRALNESGGKTIDFLSALSGIIFKAADVVVRPDGDPASAAETARTMWGACRDLVVLYNECCRSQGIAARFVSGYHEGDPDIAQKHLHAWSEVYIPGGGWRGFDPTHGLAVGAGHVALAASANPAGAAAVAGSFRGTGARAEMNVQLTIQTA